MVIGVMLSGIASGIAATVWALVTGFSVWQSLLFYPLGGMVGVALLLLLVLMRPGSPHRREAFLPAANASRG